MPEKGGLGVFAAQSFKRGDYVDVVPNGTSCPLKFQVSEAASRGNDSASARIAIVNPLIAAHVGYSAVEGTVSYHKRKNLTEPFPFLGLAVEDGWKTQSPHEIILMRIDDGFDDWEFL
ncbi:uncharacterized protein PGTG_00844 [Puccinia graminis f. sp. tritici CRL 75-36-700-3]|uniref:Uncharacterized protein n=1 Tax=Puccinia graminis f. sp. tritici (strain CRL 75-36-700-3 / race SCCL) TaxID=418459 RepID=E3JTZ2_PUCGT|nr:uncharacterized protein PGTG_00844 [Puccinia graminis f. sp. tritici CRL 75-36-700-3]EFP75513.2 hypothetical protein PGTG_00844 [Puccinia graminis f. sp. tritici CRL 75-36-700-3]